MLALVLTPGVAHADAKPHLTAARVIAIAAGDPAVGPLSAANKGAHWEVVFDAPSGTWTAVLEPRGKHNVLASFKIDDSTSAILSTTVTPKLGPPSADVSGGDHAGAALRRAAQLDRPVPGRRGHGHARRRPRVDGRLRRPRRRAGGGGPRQRHGDDADGRTHRAAGGLAAGPRRALVVRAPGQPLVGVPAALRPVPGRAGGLAPALHACARSTCWRCSRSASRCTGSTRATCSSRRR